MYGSYCFINRHRKFWHTRTFFTGGITSDPTRSTFVSTLEGFCHKFEIPSSNIVRQWLNFSFEAPDLMFRSNFYWILSWSRSWCSDAVGSMGQFRLHKRLLFSFKPLEKKHDRVRRRPLTSARIKYGDDCAYKWQFWICQTTQSSRWGLSLKIKMPSHMGYCDFRMHIPQNMAFWRVRRREQIYLQPHGYAQHYIAGRFSVLFVCLNNNVRYEIKILTNITHKISIVESSKKTTDRRASRLA